MRSSAYMLTLYFLIYITFLYLELATKSYMNVMHKLEKIDKLDVTFVGTQVFLLLLGGILAAFVIRASILFIISLICLCVGFTVIEVYNGMQKYQSLQQFDYYLLYIGMITLGIFCGLSRFIFPIFIINQDKTKHIKTKIMLFVILINLSYFTVNAILPSPNCVKCSVIIPAILYVIAMLLLIFGKYFDVFEIKSRIHNIMNIIKYFKHKGEFLFDNNVKESKEILISLSRAAIFLILLTPYGICACQVKYAFMYQFNHFQIPNISYYASGNTNFWPMVLRTSTVLIFGPIIIGLNKYTYFRNLYSNVKLKLIVGYILMIIAALISGGIETYWLNTTCNYNLTNNCSQCQFDQMKGFPSKAVNISSFIMVPSIVLNGLSEIIIFPTCFESLFKLSWKSTKYISIGFLYSATEEGGFSDFISLLIHGFYEINEMKIVNGVKICSTGVRRFDNFLYIISGVALFSLFVNIILLNKFPHRFTVNNESKDEQTLEEK